jgi:hypothetical protein
VGKIATVNPAGARDAERFGWRSGGRYAFYVLRGYGSTQALQIEIRYAERRMAVAKGDDYDSGSWTANYNQQMSAYDRLSALEAEYNFRENQKADRERAREERIRKQQEEADARAARGERARERRAPYQTDQRRQTPRDGGRILLSAGPFQRPIDAVLDWASTVSGRDEVPAVEPEVFVMSMTRNGRKYTGRYKDGKFEAWIHVPEGTPGATRRSGVLQLPATTKEQLYEALAALASRVSDSATHDSETLAAIEYLGNRNPEVPHGP